MLAARRHERRGDLAQQPVAGLVAERVVDRLELVEVEHHEAERVAPATMALEPVLERAVVEQAGQVVGARADLDRPVDLGVLERDRDLGGEQLDELELVLGEARPSPSRSSVSTPVAPSRPRSGTTIRLPSIARRHRGSG